MNFDSPLHCKNDSREFPVRHGGPQDYNPTAAIGRTKFRQAYPRLSTKVWNFPPESATFCPNLELFDFRPCLVLSNPAWTFLTQSGPFQPSLDLSNSALTFLLGTGNFQRHYCRTCGRNWDGDNRGLLGTVEYYR